MKKLFRILLSFAALMCITQQMMAFDGSTFTEGGKYYLYNLYQSKFLQSDGVTLSRTTTTADLYTATATGFTIGSTAYKATILDGTKYKFTSDAGTFMFDAGSTCAAGDYSSGFNASKSEWLLVSEDEYNAYKAKNRFTVAALNVDGMPVSIKIAGVYDLSLNPDGKEEAGATAIGKKLKTMGYDVVGMSEDFNFHSEIWDEAWNDGVTDAANGIWSYNATTHRGGISVVASTYTKYLAKTSPLFDTDGLCLFYKTSNVDQSTLESSESWTAWNEHNGYTDDGADGMIDKGYRYYTVKLADGTEFDLYILHMDAETSDADNAARASQIKQLTAAIIASNNGRPVIVMGDTNCRYTRDQIKSLFIDVLNADDRFTVKDPWIEYGRDGIYPACNGNSIMVDAEGYLKGEVVDKVFYINNKKSDIRIKALNYAQDLSFINDASEPLADHWPAVVEFDYHKYDPITDDVSENDVSGQTYYFRNKESGCYLKAGGWWGTHAVQGNYGSPMALYKLADGKYKIQSNIGYLGQGDPYMDKTESEAANWTLLENDGYYSFVYDDNGTTKALTGNDATIFPAEPGPNTRYVTCANYNGSDDWQKWELLDKNQMLTILRKATKTSPENVTYLLKGANFSRNDNDGNATWTGWPTSATRMTSNKSDGKNDFAFGNSCAEVYVSECSKIEFSCSHETKWAITQTINDLPKGTYRVTCQAFQRISNSTSTTADIYVHANDNKIMVPLMYTEPKITDSSFGGTTQSGGYYYPNSMAEATLYFNAGYYQVTIPDVTITDGTLTISIDKTSDTGKSNTAWTCFDNFQVYYLGNPDATEHFVGDMNDDDKVDITDVSAFVDMLGSNTLPTDGTGDFNEDGVCDLKDLNMLVKEILNNKFSTFYKE